MSEWATDGHVVAVADDGTLTLECHGVCTGPFVACPECEGWGERFDDEIDDEVECVDCRGTGFHDGRTRRCWITSGGAYDLYDALRDNPSPGPGRYRLRYRTDGGGDAFEVDAEFGPALDPAPGRSQNPEEDQ
jgi:hypothetical protein